jgi:hypothetical protein
MITEEEKKDLRTLSDTGLFVFKQMIDEQLNLYGVTKPSELIELAQELITIMKEREL